MTSSVWEYQKAVYGMLSGDSTLMALATGGVHELVPNETSYPYIVLTLERVDDHSTKTSRGLKIEMAVHVFSGTMGSKAGSDILNRIYTLLHLQSLTVTGATVIEQRLIDHRVAPARSANHVHSTALYRTILELN